VCAIDCKVRFSTSHNPVLITVIPHIVPITIMETGSRLGCRVVGPAEPPTPFSTGSTSHHRSFSIYQYLAPGIPPLHTTKPQTSHMFNISGTRGHIIYDTMVSPAQINSLDTTRAQMSRWNDTPDRHAAGTTTTTSTFLTRKGRHSTNLSKPVDP
jgi:hypothetical protein